MHLLNPLHPIHPGMDHFVAERAEGGFRGQRREHWPRQDDFADAWTPPIKTGRAGHAAITPTQFQRWPPELSQATGKVLPVEPVEQRR
jgi:hypothetical protein